MASQNFLSDAIDPTLEGFNIEPVRFSGSDETLDARYNNFNSPIEDTEDLGDDIGPFSNTRMNKRRKTSETLDVDTSNLTLDNIDRFIKKTEARCGPGHEHVKQLKDHKRKLRNRQSATQSRLRQRQTSTVLWNEIKKQNAIISQHMAQLALLKFRERKSRARLRHLSNWANAGITESHTKLVIRGLEANTARTSSTKERDNQNIELSNPSFGGPFVESMTHFTTEIDAISAQLLRD